MSLVVLNIMSSKIKNQQKPDHSDKIIFDDSYYVVSNTYPGFRARLFVTLK